MKTIALVGADTLLGKEMRERLSEDTSFDVRPLASLTAGVYGNLVEDVEVLDELTSAALEGVDIIINAGTPAGARKSARLRREAQLNIPLIDLTSTLEDDPQARVIAPLADPASFKPGTSLFVVANPASTVLAMLLPRIGKLAPLARAVITVFEPASERGQRGLDELQQQSIGLLSFREMPKDIYDAQLAFNLLPRYGAEAVINLEDIEALMDRHLATLLSRHDGVPMPSLRLVQAPVFHGHSFSLWLEFERSISAEDFAQALKSADTDVREGEEEVPNNVGTAAQSGITLGAIEPDRNRTNALWLWAVADNLRMIADNTVKLVQAWS